MNCDKHAMRLYAVTDRMWLNGRPLSDDVEAALKGGVSMVQLREKDLDHNAFLAEAAAIGALCRQYKVPFIINDNVEIALAVGADGVHVGQSDMRVREVRRRVGDAMIIGVSAQTAAQAQEAEAGGADYLGVGAMFTTSTKKDARPVARETLRAICGAVRIPVCAIGGIGKDNILQLAGTGVDGVALVSAIFAAPDITAACRELGALSDRMVTL